MNAQEIMKAVDAGKKVYWSNKGYQVVKAKGDYMIKAPNGHMIGLTWEDGKTLNGKEEDFFLAEAFTLKENNKSTYMKHVKLFEQFVKVNEGYYSSSDIKKLKDFAEEMSREIIDDYQDNRKFDEDEFTPEALFDYISEWGEMNDMKAKEVIDEFRWQSMTDELGLPRSY